MKIAVVGTGIAGSVAAYHLAQRHDITVFEADQRIGGHTHTVDVELAGQSYPVDTGFIVFNDWTYPNFIALLDELGVAWQPSDMSFSVQHHGTGLEYKGSTLNSLFAQRSNLLRPSFYRMVRDILRFNRESLAVLEAPDEGPLMGEYLAANGYSKEFVEHFIMPMGAAIWSATMAEMSQMPARFFIRFFKNHGMLSVNERPVWRVIKGGSRQYMDKLVAGHRERIHLNAPVESIRRLPGQVQVKVRGAEPQMFDQVFLACHSDQALAMLSDPSAAEREVLGAMAYQRNEAVLHTDASLMPRRRLAWAAWNYHIHQHGAAAAQPVAVSYNMNILQGLDAPETFCVTLNHTAAINPEKVIRTIDYDHPVFTAEAVAGQARQAELNSGRTFYCGAYWRNGFHEDGVVSALDALQHFSQRHEQDAQRDFQRAG
jgi:predicted NAD/FAD-binding protein